MTEDAEFTKLIGEYDEKPTVLRRTQWEEKQMAQSEEWFTLRECSLTRAIQCLYKRPSCTQ